VRKTTWDIDLKSGHIAHPSGLHAYISEARSSDSGPVNCVGPFSSHKDRLRKHDVQRHIADAIEAIEALDEFQNRFTYWGSLGRKASNKSQSVTVMGHEYSLIPNPCFRTNVLMTTQRLSGKKSLILREWSLVDDLTTIEHRLGSRFTFPLDERGRMSIVGHVTNIPEDILSLETTFQRATLRMLGSLALAVLNEFGAEFSSVFLRRLKLIY
jgi:hypothetical protein